jgi:glutathione-independent formaldehyde dehydrogenase
MTAGQAPVKRYNRELMMAILWDRMPYLSKVLNVEVVPMENAVDSYRVFDGGSPKKFVIDPHGMLKKASQSKSQSERELAGVGAGRK